MKTRLLVAFFFPLCLAAPLNDVFTGDQGDAAIHEHNAHEDGPEVESKERLRLLFETIDVNRDGIMDAKEFIGFCMENNIDIEETEAELRAALPDKTVGLTMDMFVELLAHCPSSKTEDIIFFLLHADLQKRQGRMVIPMIFQQWKTKVLENVFQNNFFHSLTAGVVKGLDAVCSADEVNPDACFCKNVQGGGGEACTAGQSCNSDGTCLKVCSADEINPDACFCKNVQGGGGEACTAGQSCNSDGTCLKVCTVGGATSDDCFCKLQTSNSGEVCTATQACAQDGTCVAGDCFKKNIEYLGHDINYPAGASEDRRDSASECQDLCSQRTECSFFTWKSYPYHNGECWLKTEGGPSQASYQLGSISGPKHCGNECWSIDGRATDHWCTQNCFRIPPICPEHMCTCRVIDGGWSDWSEFSVCQGECVENPLGGTKTRVRTCTNPPPANGGNNCEGLNMEFESCPPPKCIHREEPPQAEFSPPRSPQTKETTCDASTWPDLDHGLTCGDCKALINNMNSKYITCEGYCKSIDRSCSGAWEESDDSCEIKSTESCTHMFTYTSDAICECSSTILGCKGGDDCCTKENPCKENDGDCDKDDECAGDLVCGNNNCGLGYSHPFNDCCMKNSETTCDASTWPDLDHGLTCGDCKALINNMDSEYITCEGYCKTIDRSCSGAWEESDDSCEIKSTESCTHMFTYTSDAICECSSTILVTDGGWSAWSGFTQCSATCGDATKRRTRTCNDPAPTKGGKPCEESNQEKRSCNLPECGSVSDGGRLLLSEKCHRHCLVPVGQTWFVDSSIDLETITIQGTLIWDINKPDIEVKTFGILVEEGGSFQLGTPSQPMTLPAKIYIKNPGNIATANHGYVGQRYLAGLGKASIQIHGRPLQRTWTLLARNHGAGESQLDLKDDADRMGWRVGDRVGVATTIREESTIHHITSITGNSIKIDPPLNAEHWGGWRDIEGLRFEMAAEVVNMERNIVITGDHDDFHKTGLGWHGGLFNIGTYGQSPARKRSSEMGTAALVGGDVGVWDVRYARMEFCGQLDIMGRYCNHFHLVQHCPQCIIQGNAFVESYQSAVTIHGTHSSLVDSNVMWDNRGVAIYTEDGNEIYNVISNNAIVCRQMKYCRIKWLRMVDRTPKEGGIFMFGMANDVIGNHVVSHEHGMWTPGAAHRRGRGFAKGTVCPKFVPFGKIQHNVFHDCQRFGTYVDFQYPRKVNFNWNGMQDSKESCDEFTKDGHDNGDNANLIEDQFDWHNSFVGGYRMGDISWVRYTSVNNLHGLYWKWSKNFADGVSYHIRDSVIVNDRNDHVKGKLQMLLPGGPHVFRMKNVTFAGGPIGAGVIAAPQHCGLKTQNKNIPGSMCNVQYLLEDLDFSRVNPRKRESVELLHFGASGGNPVSPLYIAGDDSLDGHHVVVSNFMDGFAKVEGCEGPVAKYGGGYACNEMVQVRRINIWAPDMGDLKLTGPGYDTDPNWDADIMGSNAGYLHYDNKKIGVKYQIDHGYGAHVIIGESYTLEGLTWRGDIVVEVSDPILPDYFKKPQDEEGITLTLKLKDGRSTKCYPNAGESRLWHSTDGISLSNEVHIRFTTIGECGRAFYDLVNHG